MKTKDKMLKDHDSPARSIMTRRNFLILGGGGIAATVANSAGFLSSAGAQSVPSPSPVQIGKESTLPREHFLSKALIESTQTFPIGTRAVKLDVSPKGPIVGVVTEYHLENEAARRFGQKTLVLESAMTALQPGSDGLKAVQSAFHTYKMPEAISNSANFAVLTVRQRNTTSDDRLDISKQVPIAKESTAIIGVTAGGEGEELFIYLLPPAHKSPKTGKNVRPPIVTFKRRRKNTDSRGGGGGGGTTSTPPPHATQEEHDFGDCWLGCAAVGYGAASPFIGTLSTACVSAIIALPATAGLDAVLAIPSCTVDLILLAAPAVICAGYCLLQ